jgi:hypothetical protein
MRNLIQTQKIKMCHVEDIQKGLGKQFLQISSKTVVWNSGNNFVPSVLIFQDECLEGNVHLGKCPVIV